MAVAYTALTLSPWRPQSAGLFVSGSVFFYCTYLTWGALTSQPAGTCVPASGSTLPIQVRGCNWFDAPDVAIEVGLTIGLQ